MAQLFSRFFVFLMNLWHRREEVGAITLLLVTYGLLNSFLGLTDISMSFTTKWRERHRQAVKTNRNLEKTEQSQRMLGAAGPASPDDSA